MLKTVVKKGSYQDSVVLMLLTNEISTIEGVKKDGHEGFHHDGDSCKQRYF